MTNGRSEIWLIEPGARFSGYVIVGPLGAGGMGQVWRATDTALKRDVAIKVLPPAFVDDPDRLARFQREAELLAALNHANIAQIYGFESSGGRTALIMELVEGPTLADRIERGAVPFDEALGIAEQILAALESAHAKGIVHRDLKPANIKLARDGSVKVLDFGIAKALGATAQGSGPGQAQLTTPAITEAGIALGNDVGFFGSGSTQLMRVGLDGSPARNLAPVAGFNGADSTDDGTIVVSAHWGGTITVIGSGTGEMYDLSVLDLASGERAHLWPDVLPDRRNVLFTVWSGDPSWDNAKLAVGSIDGGAHRIVLEGATTGRYVDSGHIVLWRREALWAVPFDLDRLQTTGEPVRVVADVRLVMARNTYFARTAAARLSRSSSRRSVITPAGCPGRRMATRWSTQGSQAPMAIERSGARKWATTQSPRSSSTRRPTNRDPNCHRAAT